VKNKELGDEKKTVESVEIEQNEKQNQSEAGRAEAGQQCMAI
jgi:hypothetical protein